VRQLTDALRVLVDGAPPVLEGWLGQLKEVLGLEQVAGYGVQIEPTGFALDGAFSQGFPRTHAQLLGEMNGLLRAAPRWGFFNPARPEPLQRNRAVRMGAFAAEWASVSRSPSLLRSRYGMNDVARHALADSVERSAETYARMGVGGQSILRALICEGDVLLSWIGGLRAEPFTQADSRLLAAVIPALMRRLSTERLLGTSRVTSLALAAALEEISRPAYVVTAKGGVAATNALGRAALGRSPEGVRRALVEALQAGEKSERFRVTSLLGPGLPMHALLVEAGGPDASGLAAVAARRWGLTEREREVLVQIAHGRANKTISVELGCSDKTVELHVTRLLRKTEVDSRSALIAKMWQQHG
jgi:DNA-binding CsgD family transcriptional regulator